MNLDETLASDLELLTSRATKYAELAKIAQADEDIIETGRYITASMSYSLAVKYLLNLKENRGTNGIHS
jgi:hypothetical protein